MLLVVAVVKGQHLLAMRRIVGGIDVEDDASGPSAACADEQLGEVVVENLQALVLSRRYFQKDGPLFQRQIGFAAREGLSEARQSGAAGQGLGVFIGRQIEQGVKERIIAKRLSVVAIGVASQDLVDLLSEERFA